MLRRRRYWKLVLGALLVAVVLQLPFLHLLPSFWAAVLGRSKYIQSIENISPAIFVWMFQKLLVLLFAHGIPAWKLIYLLLWAGTLAYRLRRDRDEDISMSWPGYVPWMISYPTSVFPYTGLLVLALLALIAGKCQNRLPLLPEKFIVTGATLLGFQATAWATALAFLGREVPKVHLVCAAGSLLILIGACALPNYFSMREA